MLIVSGYIKIKNGNKVKARITSGNISLNGEEMAILDVVSGDVEIDGVNDVYVDINMISRDVNIGNSDRYVENVLKINMTSGDIFVK